jgi:phytoene dehydrogenase-like protein
MVSREADAVVIGAGINPTVAAADTHPGPGLGGGSGHLVAQQLLFTSRAPGRLLRRFRS